MINNLSLFIVTFFYIGKIKYAPGTFSSLATLIIWILLIPTDYFIRILIIFFLIIIGFVFTRISLSNFKETDPQSIVIDEVVGMMIGLFLLPKNIPIYIMAFILFRFFDIIKPSIIDRSQNFKFGIGIMADDIISGILTLLIIKGLYI